jgi:hypothetical protein
MADTSPAAPEHLPDPATSQPGLFRLPPAPIPASAGCNTAQRWTTVLDGQRLRQLRRQHGLSQEKLADRAGISLTTVARLDGSPAHPAAAAP